jgi:hypothetical protein
METWMRTLQISTKTDRDGHLRLDMPLARSVVDISVIVVMAEVPNQGRYDCSDLVGKLAWRGDAVTEQRRLREEWR